MSPVVLSVTIALFLTILGEILGFLSPGGSVPSDIGLGIMFPGLLLAVLLWGVHMAYVHSQVTFYVVVSLANFTFYFLLIFLIMKIVVLFGRFKSH